MKVAIINLGCKVNRVESDTIALSYLNRGATLASPKEADVIVVNTCTVTGEAEKKTRKHIRRALRENTHARVLVTGCAAVISPTFFASLSDRVSVVDKAELLEEGGVFESASAPTAAQASNFLRTGKNFPCRVGVKVQDGCNHACTYCIVHVARGRAWSRSPEAIEQEVRSLIEAGVKEIVLTGIDLGSYRYCKEATGAAMPGNAADTSQDSSLSKSNEVSLVSPGMPCQNHSEHTQTNPKDASKATGTITLARLLRRLLALADKCNAPNVRFRVSSVEPRSIDSDFISLLAEAKGRVCRHVHLPLQSGSSKVLREMHRPYSAQDYCDLVARMRKQVPTLSLTTDIIVGFPGETEEDFQETCAVARKVNFSKIHVFRYSKREGTPAAARPDQISAEVKEDRAGRLIHLGDELRRSFAEAMLGRCETIVTEQPGLGMTESYYKVRFDARAHPDDIFRARLAQVDSDGVLFAL